MYTHVFSHHAICIWLSSGILRLRTTIRFLQARGTLNIQSLCYSTTQTT